MCAFVELREAANCQRLVITLASTATDADRGTWAVASNPHPKASSRHNFNPQTTTGLSEFWCIRAILNHAYNVATLYPALNGHYNDRDGNRWPLRTGEHDLVGVASMLQAW